MFELKFIWRSIETKGNIINSGDIHMMMGSLTRKDENKTCWWHCMCSINLNLVSNFALLNNTHKKTIRKSFRTSTLFYLHFSFTSAFNLLFLSLRHINDNLQWDANFLLRAKKHLGNCARGNFSSPYFYSL